MRLDKITLQVVRAQLQRLILIFGTPNGFKADADAFTREWLYALKWLRADELETAVGLWLSGGSEYFPKPGQLLALVQTAKRAVPMQATNDRVPDDWYAFPVTPHDTEGPRVRLMPTHEARAKGYGLANDASCPVPGCECFSVSVWLEGGLFGLSPIRAGPLVVVHPKGWRWAHYATEKKMIPAKGDYPTEAR